MEYNEYRLVESYGNFFNKRWEVQQKYSYYENGNKIESWYAIFHSVDKNRCLEAMEKYKAEPRKRNRDRIWII